VLNWSLYSTTILYVQGEMLEFQCLTKLNAHMTFVLWPDDGSIRAETCRRQSVPKL